MSRKKTQKRRIGRPPKHYGYSLPIHRDGIIAEHPELRQWLQGCRDGLIDNLGGVEDELTQAQQIIVDRVISKLSMVRLIEIYLAKNGILRRDRVQEKILEAEPIVQIWLQVNNAIRSDLQILGIDKRQIESEPTLADIIREHDEAQAKRAQEATCVGVNEDKSPEPIADDVYSALSEDSGANGPGGGAVEGEENE